MSPSSGSSTRYQAKPITRRADPASLRPQPSRLGPDFWPTPASLAAALVRFVLPKDAPLIWEPAAGDGALVKVIRKAGWDVVATDLEPRARGIRRRDFLHDPPPAPGMVVVTNPPFNALDQFIDRGLVLLDTGAISGLVLLVRHDAMTAACRAPALDRAYRIWTCTWRPRWIEGTDGQPRWSFVWAHWSKHSDGPPQARWITPEDLRNQRLPD